MDKVKILNIDGVDYEVEDAQARELWEAIENGRL